MIGRVDFGWFRMVSDDSDDSFGCYPYYPNHPCSDDFG